MAKVSPAGFYRAMGFLTFGALAVRADIVERLASRAWAVGRKGAFPLTGEAAAGLMSLAGCGAEEMAEILKGLGYRGRKDNSGVVRFRHQEARSGAAATGKKQKVKKDSPFDKLNGLTVAQGK